MTTEQIHRIVYLHGLIKGNNGVNPHRTKEYIKGQTVGLDYIRYKEGFKAKSQKVRVIYNDVTKGNPWTVGVHAVIVAMGAVAEAMEVRESFKK